MIYVCNNPNKLFGDDIDVGYSYMLLIWFLMLAASAQTGNQKCEYIWGTCDIWPLVKLNFRTIFDLGKNIIRQQ